MADFLDDLLTGIIAPTQSIILPIPGADETPSPFSTLVPQPTSVDLDQDRPTVTPSVDSELPSATPSQPSLDDDEETATPTIPILTASSELPISSSLILSTPTGLPSTLPTAITRPPTTLLSSLRAAPTSAGPLPSDEELIVAPPQPTTLVAVTTTVPLPSQTSSLAAPIPTAEEANAGSGGNGALMPALPISLGLVAGVLVIGGVVGWAYRKGRGPFAGRARRRAMMEKEDMEDGEIDRRERQKWEPRVSRMGGHAVNF
ncbi:hypothetical protein ACHAQA_003708 [Verticillium albo-atrum]